MKRFYTLFILIALSAAALHAQSSAVKKAARGVLKITTFKADGTLLATGYGAFIDGEGTALTAWTPLVGASSAVVIDGKGNKYDVDCIYGASDIYNIARLKVKLGEKADINPLAIEEGQQAVGGDSWFIHYDVSKPQFTKVSPMKVEAFMNTLPYYVYEQATATITDDHTGGVVVTPKGELMGLVKTSSTRTDFFIASARYALTLQPGALSANDNTLRHTDIRIALPSDHNQALLALLVATQRTDSIQ